MEGTGRDKVKTETPLRSRACILGRRSNRLTKRGLCPAVPPNRFEDVSFAFPGSAFAACPSYDYTITLTSFHACM